MARTVIQPIFGQHGDDYILSKHLIGQQRRWQPEKWVKTEIDDDKCQSADNGLSEYKSFWLWLRIA